MKLADLTQPYRQICDNCLNSVIVYKNGDGLIKYQCPVCGTRIVVQRLSRYHVVKDLRFPKGKM